MTSPPWRPGGGWPASPASPPSLVPETLARESISPTHLLVS